MAFSQGAYTSYVTKKKRKFDEVFPLPHVSEVKEERYEQDKENADFSMGVY